MAPHEAVWVHRVRWLLPLLVLAHVLLAYAYAQNTPYRQSGVLLFQGRAEARDIGAPDERQHVNYVARLAKGEGLPVFDPKDPDLYETYQSHQPPLYYLLAAGWTRMLALDPSTESGGEGLRLFSSLLGAGTVVGVFFMGFWGFGRASVGVISAAFAALLPMHVALSGAVSNDPLLILLCTWSLAVMARGSAEGWSVQRATALGVLIGLALLTKTTAVALLPVALLAMLWHPSRNLKLIALGAGLSLLIPLAWWIRNQQLYGDPLAISAFNEAFVGSPKASMFIQELGSTDYWLHWVGWWTARSFIGVFGYMDVFLPDTLYRLMIALMLVLFLLWVLSLGKKEWRPHGRVQVLNGLFLLVVVLLFVRFNLQYFQAQARYILPALAVISTGVGVGLAAALDRKAWAGFWALVVLFGGLNGYILSILPDEFSRRIG